MKFYLLPIFVFFSTTAFNQVSFAQNNPQCGTRGPKGEDINKIVGGVEATPHEFPWVVYFYGFHLDEIYPYTCTGSLIHPQFVLTAGHCLNSFYNTSKSEIFAAVHNVSSTQESEKISVKVVDFIRHPKYAEVDFILDNIIHITAANDVALLKLATPLDITGNAFLGTICVPEQSDAKDAYVGRIAITAGWGWTRELGLYSPDVLMKVDLPVVSMDYCVKQANLTVDVNSMICTYSENGKGTCQGDSGGPLMLKLDGRWTVVGTTSWSIGCAAKGHPGAWAHTSLFSDWIWETVKKNL